jgi:hypothetical protein
MSCDGWNIGDRCVARLSFEAGELSIATGAPGAVVAKDARLHEITVAWGPDRQRVRFSHDEIHTYLVPDTRGTPA